MCIYANLYIYPLKDYSFLLFLRAAASRRRYTLFLLILPGTSSSPVTLQTHHILDFLLELVHPVLHVIVDEVLLFDVIFELLIRGEQNIVILLQFTQLL